MSELKQAVVLVLMIAGVVALSKPVSGPAPAPGPTSISVPSPAKVLEHFPRRNAGVEAYEKAHASVVTILTPHAAGAGVIVDSSGLILTCNHLIDGCERPKVRLSDGAIVPAQVVFLKSRWDLAALRIPTDKLLPARPLTNTDDLRVGEEVFVIGHPVEQTDTLTRGIVSGLNRRIAPEGTSEILMDLIQVDAAISAGHSGGPLLNVNGELIGIVCAMHTQAKGVGFAINANTAMRVIRMYGR